MKTTTTSQNLKSTRGSDLGQITVRAWFYEGSKKYNTEGGWMASITNKDGFETTYRDGDPMGKARWIDYGNRHENGYKNNPLSAFFLAMALANLTSKSKASRDHAKEKVRIWESNGKALAEIAQAAIDEAKKKLNSCNYSGPLKDFDAGVKTYGEESGTWNGFANSGMRYPEESDLIGGSEE